MTGKIQIPKSLDRTLFISRRRQLPWSYVIKEPSIGELHSLVSSLGRLFPKDKDLGHLGYKVCSTGLIFMNRDLWFESTAFNESLIYWGWMEIDLGFRLERKCQIFDLGNANVEVYHLEHYPKRIFQPRKCNQMLTDNPFAPNDENWGMNSYDLKVYKCDEIRYEHVELLNLKPKLSLSLINFVSNYLVRRFLTWLFCKGITFLMFIKLCIFKVLSKVKRLI